MCGIAAVFAVGTRRVGGEDQLIAERMRAAQAHRGPDATTGDRGPRHVLLFDRLSVNALATGQQPLYGPGGLVAAVNGEIYNHRALEARDRLVPSGGGSDCAVVPSLFFRLGRKAFAELRGIFAAVLWDEDAGVVHLVRDPFGVKPLFYCLRDGRLLVASELKGIFASGRVPAEPDWHGAIGDSSFNLTGGLTGAPGRTYFSHVSTVPPGSGVTVHLDTGRIEEWSYWSLPRNAEGPVVSAEELVSCYRVLLEQAVDRSCMTDVPVTIFLSGGVDSGVVAALAARRLALTAWTVLSRNTVESGDFASATHTAGTLGIPLSWVETTEAERSFGLDEWLRVLHASETPLAGPEQYWKMAMLQAAQVHGEPFKVVLTGQGSDEFNGGYTSVGSPDGSWEGFMRSLAARQRRSRLDELPGAYAALDLATRGCVREEWWSSESAALGNHDDLYTGYLLGKSSDLQRFNCWHEDRVAAAYGVESRPPFLDVDLVEFSTRIPTSLRAELLCDKRILRQAARTWLPADLAERPKAPFFYAARRSVGLAMLTTLLSRHGDELVDLAVSAPTSSAVLSPDALRRAVRAAVRHPERKGIEQVLRLLSLGALEALLTPPATVAATGPLDLSRMRVGSLGSDTDHSTDQGARDLLVAPPLDGSATVVLRREVQLYHRAGTSHPAPLFVARGGLVEYSIRFEAEPLLSALLPLLTRPVTVDALVAATGHSAAEVNAKLNELVDLSLLDFPARTPRSIEAPDD